MKERLEVISSTKVIKSLNESEGLHKGHNKSIAVADITTCTRDYCRNLYQHRARFTSDI